MIAQDLVILFPELLLTVGAMAGLVWGAFVRNRPAGAIMLWLAALFMGVAAVWITALPATGGGAFGGSFVDDAFARFSKVLLLLSAALTLLVGRDYLERQGLLEFEFPLLVAFAVVGMMVMVSARDLMVLYMGIELQSLSLYVMAAFHRDNARSTEAGLKYFVLGALSSGLLLYGASFVYGYTGTTSFDGIREALEGSDLPRGVIYGLVFMITGLAFKISAAPFHMWAPDVYQGAPTVATALFATAPKVAAMALLARLLFEAFPAADSDWQPIITVLAVASMFLGAVAAIRQTDIKRLMAYSSISHMGFALIGIAAATEGGLQATLLYMAIYAVTNLGAFALIISMRRDGRAVTDIAALNMFARAAPMRAFAFLLLLFSLAGIVPLVGFFAKFYVFVAAVNAGLTWLAVAGGIASVIGAFYYLRIVYFMYFGEQRSRLDPVMPAIAVLVLVGAAAAMILGIVNLFGIDGLALTAAGSLFA